VDEENVCWLVMGILADPSIYHGASYVAQQLFLGVLAVDPGFEPTHEWQEVHKVPVVFE
jgi:hypothetical protein